MAMTDTVEEEQATPVAEARPEAVPLPDAWPSGTDHKAVGTLFIVLGLVFLVAGGALSLILRAQLSKPDGTVTGARTYQQLFTMHGVFLVFLFLLPVWLGIASAVVPLQVGASRMAFPRLHALSFWMFLGGAGMVAAAPTLSDVFSGWTLSSPIPEALNTRGHGPDLLMLGLILVAVAAVTVAVNLLCTILQLRAPGLAMRRVPVFTWSVLVSAAVLLFCLPVLIGALLMLYLDRHYGGDLFHGFTGSRGGNPLLWPRLFWFAAYPLLWALLLPALGTVSEIVQTFAGRPLFKRAAALPALGAVGVLSFIGWGSEVSNLTRSRPLFAIGALVILAPVASLVVNWLLTLRAGGAEGDRDSLRRRFLEPPMLWALGLLPVLALGLAGAAVSAVDAGRRSHRNYWQVAEHHSLFFGAATIGALAALSYWGPKIWGRRQSSALGRLEVLAVVGGTLLTVLAFFALGIQDMATHLPTYTSDDGWGPANLAASVGGAIVVLGLVLFLLDLLVSVLGRRGKPAGPDPWGGHTLEWATTSPPPIHNFDALPEIRSETPLLDLRAVPQTAPAAPPQEAG